MANHSGVVEHRLVVDGNVTVSGVAALGADVLSGGLLQVNGVVGAVHVGDGGVFRLNGVMSEDLSVEVDAEVWIAGIFQGQLIDAPEGVLVAEGALVNVAGEALRVMAGVLTHTEGHIGEMHVGKGPWYRWWGDMTLEPLHARA